MNPKVEPKMTSKNGTLNDLLKNGTPQMTSKNGTLTLTSKNITLNDFEECSPE